MSGWRVISWALVLSGPVAWVPFVAVSDTNTLNSPLSAWLSVAYLVLVSQFLGFFVWYRAMAVIGVARTGQLQLLMPFITLLASAAWLEEEVAAM